MIMEHKAHKTNLAMCGIPPNVNKSRKKYICAKNVNVYFMQNLKNPKNEG